MVILHSLVSAFSCFSQIPMPQLQWREDSCRYMMAFFPLVGVAVALLLWAWLAVCDAANLNFVLRGIGIALVPVIVTGGIHLDGLADVIDAQSSNAPAEKKREILKDPHTGAFAIIGLCLYMLLYVGFAIELPYAWQLPVVLGGAYVCERCLSAAAVMVFPKSSNKGMMASESEMSDKKVTLAALVVLFIAASVAMILVSPVAGGAVVATTLACWGWLRVFSKRQFGGMSGDLCGCYTQVSEIVCVIVLVIVAKAVGL